MAEGYNEMPVGALFTNNIYATVNDITRNGNTLIWTAPRDCLVYIHLVIENNCNGGYANTWLYKNNSILAQTQSPELISGQRHHQSPVSAICQFKANDQLYLMTGYTNNSSPVRAFYSLSY